MTWRITVGLVGGLILLGGIAMCITPGPGIGGIILGLAILSTEFSWARRLLWRARRYAHDVRLKADHALKERRVRRGRGSAS
ncbi:PGPGW domain-containing protein [Actinorugispora endophytica]|uniref:PGPGW domain-containing protein n=1 Tax=Actinorugispora endophytica TaxID=1605990 RepID=UPI00312C7527